MISVNGQVTGYFKVNFSIFLLRKESIYAMFIHTKAAALQINLKYYT